MKRALWITGGSVLIVVASLFAFAAVVLSSEWGLSWAMQRAEPHIPGELSVQAFHGTLRGPIVLEGVVWRNEGLTIEIGRIELEWQPLQLLHGEARVTRLALDTVKAQQGAITAPRPEILLKNFVAPLKITVQQGAVSSLSYIAAPERSALQIERIGVAAQWSGEEVTIDQFDLEAPMYTARISGHLTTRDAYPLKINGQWTLRWPERPEVRGEGHIEGDLTRMQFAQQLLAPVKVSVDGVVSDLLKTPQWETRVVGSGVDLAVIDHRWALGALDLDVSARSAGDAIQSTGSIRSGHAVTGPFTVSWKGLYEKTRITFDELNAQLAESRSQLRARVVVELNPQAPDGVGQIDVQGKWSALRWPLRDTESVSSASGEFSLAGTTEEYRFTLAGPVRGANIPASEVKLAGVGHAREVTLQTIDIAMLGGSLQGDATLQWGDRVRWKAQLRGAQLNPGIRWSEWPGRLNLAASADGEVRDAHVVTHVALTKLDGVLRGYPLQAQTRMTLDNNSYAVDQAELRSGKSRVRAHGTLTDHWTLDWDLDAPDVAALYPALSGAISASGQVRGPRDMPRLRYAVRGSDVRFQSVSVGQFDSRGDVDLNTKQPTTINARAADVEISGWRADELQLSVDGALDAHRAVVTLRAPDSSADIALGGRWNDGAWNAQLERAAFTVPRFGHWTLDEPVALSASATAARWASACWRGAVGRLCTQGTWVPVDGVDAQVTLADAPLEGLQSLLPEGIKLSGALNASLHVWVPPPEQNHPLRAELHAQLTPGHIVVAEVAEEPMRFEHRGGVLNLVLDAQGARANANVDFAQLGLVVATAQLPGWKPGTAPRDQPVTGSVRADVRELGFLTRWLPTVEQIQGVLKADVRIGGLLSEPRFEGEVTLSDGAAALPQLGIKLSRVNIEVSQHAEQRVEFHATASSGPGSVNIRGDVVLDRAAGWPVTLEVTGKEFETINLPEAWVLASPELFVSKVRNRIDLGGVLQIPQARYTARDVSGALSPSSDVVMTGGAEKTQKEEKWQIYTAVRFVFGDKVSFNGFGLKGLVRGEVVAIDEPKKLTTGYGELQVVDGIFNAYKIDLKVTRGRLLFAGGPINNPGIDARAIREAGAIRQTTAKSEKTEALREPGAVIAGVLVRGTLRKLELTLFSEPPRDQADVLSLLLFGVPLGDATSEEGKALFIAASSLRLTGRDDTLRKIGRRFGIDEIRLDAGTTPEQASLVIGRYLGPRLYVNYSVGLISTGSNVLRVRYRVSDKWMLQSEQSDAESAADLLFTFER